MPQYKVRRLPISGTISTVSIPWGPSALASPHRNRSPSWSGSSPHRRIQAISCSIHSAGAEYAARSRPSSPRAARRRRCSPDDRRDEPAAPACRRLRTAGAGRRPRQGDSRCPHLTPALSLPTVSVWRKRFGWHTYAVEECCRMTYQVGQHSRRCFLRHMSRPIATRRVGTTREGTSRVDPAPPDVSACKTNHADLHHRAASVEPDARVPPNTGCTYRRVGTHGCQTRERTPGARRDHA